MATYKATEDLKDLKLAKGDTIDITEKPAGRLGACVHFKQLVPLTDKEQAELDKQKEAAKKKVAADAKKAEADAKKAVEPKTE